MENHLDFNYVLGQIEETGILAHFTAIYFTVYVKIAFSVDWNSKYLLQLYCYETKDKP